MLKRIPSDRALGALILNASLALAAAGGIGCQAAPVPSEPAVEEPPASPTPDSQAVAESATKTVKSTPGEPAEDGRPLNTAFLVIDGVYNTELVAPMDVFQHTRYQLDGRPAMEVFTVSPTGDPIKTFEGLSLDPDYGFDDHPPIDVLVVPSAAGSRDRDLENREMIEWVRRVGGEAQYAVSLCWGAFVLAEAGLLDGGTATTFPADYHRFAEAYPEIDVRVNVSFVQDGRMLTSQGGVRSYDVAMYLVEHLYGREVAQGIGGGLLIPWPPALDASPPFAIESRG